MPRPIALLNVDRTLTFKGHPMNKLLVDALVAKEILDVYLFTEISINQENIRIYSAIVRMLEGMAEGMDRHVRVHGILTPSDLAWNEKSGAGPESAARLEAEAMELLGVLQSQEISPLPRFQISSRSDEDATSGAYTFLDNGAFTCAQSSETAGFLSPEAMVVAIRKHADARSPVGRLKQVINAADSPFSGWRAIARGYQPLEQLPGQAFAEAAAAFEAGPRESMAARCDLSKIFADHFASMRHLTIKALMLDLLLHRTAWISSITVVDTPENIVKDFHPISFERDHALIPIGWVAVDMRVQLSSGEEYLGSLQESLYKDHVMHICAELNVKILTAQKTEQEEDVVVFTSLKQAILADGEDGVERDLGSIVDDWVAANAASAVKHALFLEELKKEYATDSLTRVRLSAPLPFQVMHGSTAHSDASITPAGSV